MSYENEFEQVFDKLAVTKNYHSTLTLLQSAEYKSRVKVQCADAIQACCKYLTDDHYEGDLDLYCCCEEFLKYVANISPPDEVLLELLEVIETSRSDNVFTSALKALQICLQNQKQNQVNGLEWSLNSIHSFVTEIKLPVALEGDCDAKQELLLEQDRQVQRILMNLITITLFLEPIVESVISESRDPDRIFRDVTRNRRNILACFVLQLLGSQLAMLDLSNRENPSTNTNSLHCAKTLAEFLCKLLGDPLFLLSYGEDRIRWKRKRVRDDDGVYENSPKDVFLIEEKTPLTAMGVFYYLLLSERMLPFNAPKVYLPTYTFEMSLYLVHNLLGCKQSALTYKGIRLGVKTVENLALGSINVDSLGLLIHQDFCMSLSNLIVFSTIERNRKDALQLLKDYILRFNDPGQFYLLQNLIRTTKHNGLKGFLIGMYKDLIATSCNSKELPTHFRTSEFKTFLMQNVCTLPKKVETDLVEHSEQILAALNLIRFLTIRDKENRLGFWNFTQELERNYLKPMRQAIDLSRAHFKVEQKSVNECNEEMIRMPKEISITMQMGGDLPEFTKEEKLKILDRALLTFDLMESLLAIVNECIHVGQENKV